MTNPVPQKQKVVVLDVETTGLWKQDRIVEITIIRVDPLTMEPLDEYDTLINPMRDVGATHVHGITASMVDTAPTFAEVAPAIARRLDGAILIGHNISFDIRFLTQEFERLGASASFDAGTPICTYRLSGLSLDKAVKAFNLTSQPTHRSLTDARATAELAVNVITDEVDAAPAFCVASGDPNPRTLRRGGVDPKLKIERRISVVDSPWNGSPSGMYRYVLNYVLDDGVIDSRERIQLQNLARELALTAEHQLAICRLHLATLVAAVERDGIISQTAREYLERNATSMGLGAEPLPQMTEIPAGTSLQVGMSFCVTGDATHINPLYTHEYIEQRAVLARLVMRPSVTKKLDLLVLADLASQSSKARAARKYGIRIMSVNDFLNQVS